MHFLSDAYRLREAIIAERREERAAHAAGNATAAGRPGDFAVKRDAGKTARRPFRFMMPTFRLPLVAPAGKSK